MTGRVPHWLSALAIVCTAGTVDARPARSPAAAVQVDPESARAAAALAQEAKTAFQKKDFAAAAEQYRRAFALNPSRPDFLYDAGRSAQLAGNVPQAREALETLRRQLAPRHPLQAKAAAALVAMQDVVAEPVVVIPPQEAPLSQPPVAPAEVAVPCAVPTHAMPAELPHEPTCVAPPPAERTPDVVTMASGGLLMLAGAGLAIWAQVDRSALPADSGSLRGADAMARVHSVSVLAVISAVVGTGVLAVGWYGHAATRPAPTVMASPTSLGLAWQF